MPLPLAAIAGRTIARTAGRQALQNIIQKEVNNLVQKQIGELAKAASEIRPRMEVNKAQLARLNQGFQTFAAKGKKSLRQQTTATAFWISIHYAKSTYAGNRTTIRSQLMAVSKLSKNLTVMEAIIVSRARKAGEKLTKREVKQRAKKAIGARTKAVGSLRVAGWWGAKQLRYVAGIKGYNNLPTFGKAKGLGKPAQATWTPTARFEVLMLAGNDPLAYNYMAKGLDVAVIAQGNKLWEMINKDLQKSAKEFNAGR